MNEAYLHQDPGYVDPFAGRAPTPPPPPRGLLIFSGVLSVCTSALYLILGGFMLLLGSLVLSIFMSGRDVADKVFTGYGLIAVVFTLLAALGIAAGALTIARRRWAVLINVALQLLFVGAWSCMMVNKPNALTACLILLDLTAAALGVVGLRKLSAWAAQGAAPAVR